MGATLRTVQSLLQLRGYKCPEHLGVEAGGLDEVGVNLVAPNSSGAYVLVMCEPAGTAPPRKRTKASDKLLRDSVHAVLKESGNDAPDHLIEVRPDACVDD